MIMELITAKYIEIFIQYKRKEKTHVSDFEQLFSFKNQSSFQ